MNLLRYVPLSKFLGFRKIFDDEEDARAKAEPEDQDYYGLGSRSARFTINMVIGIVYSTLSPTVALLACMNFFCCRVFYGYLIPFAETKKPDLGGVFWVTKLELLHWQLHLLHFDDRCPFWPCSNFNPRHYG